MPTSSQGDELIRFLTGRGRIVGPRAIEVNGETVGGDAILIATGSRSMIPRLKGIKEVDYLTNETAFELNELPESLIVVGGVYIALECAQMFSRFGSRVTVVQRSQHLLSRQPVEVGEGLAEYLRDEGVEIRHWCGTDACGLNRRRRCPGGSGQRGRSYLDRDSHFDSDRTQKEMRGESGLRKLESIQMGTALSQ